MKRHWMVFSIFILLCILSGCIVKKKDVLLDCVKNALEDEQAEIVAQTNYFETYAVIVHTKGGYKAMMFQGQEDAQPYFVLMQARVLDTDDMKFMTTYGSNSRVVFGFSQNVCNQIYDVTFESQRVSENIKIIYHCANVDGFTLEAFYIPNDVYDIPHVDVDQNDCGI